MLNLPARTAMLKTSGTGTDASARNGRYDAENFRGPGPLGRIRSGVLERHAPRTAG